MEIHECVFVALSDHARFQKPASQLIHRLAIEKSLQPGWGDRRAALASIHFGGMLT